MNLMLKSDDSTTHYNAKLIREDQLTIDENNRIKNLLVSAYPQYADIFSSASYWGARPQYRLLIETQDGELVSHLDFESRAIQVGKHEILIAGVGEVATHPQFQNRGLGRMLMSELHSNLQAKTTVAFAYLQCRTAVLGFYTRVGWYEVTNQVQYIDPDTNQLTIGDSHSLILPVLETLDQWPDGNIDLQGMPW